MLCWVLVSDKNCMWVLRPGDTHMWRVQRANGDRKVLRDDSWAIRGVDTIIKEMDTYSHVKRVEEIPSWVTDALRGMMPDGI